MLRRISQLLEKCNDKINGRKLLGTRPRSGARVGTRRRRDAAASLHEIVAVHFVVCRTLCTSRSGSSTSSRVFLHRADGTRCSNVRNHLDRGLALAKCTGSLCGLRLTRRRTRPRGLALYRSRRSKWGERTQRAAPLHAEKGGAWEKCGNDLLTKSVHPLLWTVAARAVSLRPFGIARCRWVLCRAQNSCGTLQPALRCSARA